MVQRLFVGPAWANARRPCGPAWNGPRKASLIADHDTQTGRLRLRASTALPARPGCPRLLSRLPNRTATIRAEIKGVVVGRHRGTPLTNRDRTVCGTSMRHVYRRFVDCCRSRNSRSTRPWPLLGPCHRDEISPSNVILRPAGTGRPVFGMLMTSTVSPRMPVGSKNWSEVEFCFGVRIPCSLNKIPC